MTALRCENDMKRLISVFLSAAMLLSLAVLSAAAGYNTAYKIGDVDGNGFIFVRPFSAEHIISTDTDAG